MRTEVDKLIPLPREHLTAEDWKENRCGLHRSQPSAVRRQRGEHEYEALFRKILNLAPPSLGVGPRD